MQCLFIWQPLAAGVTKTNGRKTVQIVRLLVLLLPPPSSCRPCSDKEMVNRPMTFHDEQTGISCDRKQGDIPGK
jgi:hypothetical protein